MDGLRLNVKAGGAIANDSIVVFTATKNEVVAGGSSNCAKIAGVATHVFNKQSITAGDTVAVIANGEVIDVRKVTGTNTAIAAGEYVMCGDATGAAAKATAAVGAPVYVVGQAVESSTNDDAFVTVRVSPFMYTA